MSHSIINSVTARLFTPTCDQQQYLLQGQWLVRSGATQDCTFQNTLWVFDFSSFQWQQADVTGTPLDARADHMAVCHQGAMLIMGGELSSFYHALLAFMGARCCDC